MTDNYLDPDFGDQSPLFSLFSRKLPLPSESFCVGQGIKTDFSNDSFTKIEDVDNQTLSQLLEAKFRDDCNIQVSKSELKCIRIKPVESLLFNNISPVCSPDSETGFTSLFSQHKTKSTFQSDDANPTKLWFSQTQNKIHERPQIDSWQQNIQRVHTASIDNRVYCEEQLEQDSDADLVPVNPKALRRGHPLLEQLPNLGYQSPKDAMSNGLAQDKDLDDYMWEQDSSEYFEGCREIPCAKPTTQDTEIVWKHREDLMDKEGSQDTSNCIKEKKTNTKSGSASTLGSGSRKTRKSKRKPKPNPKFEDEVCDQSQELGKCMKDGMKMYCKECNKYFSAQGYGGHRSRVHKGQNPQYRQKLAIRKANEAKLELLRQAQYLYLIRNCSDNTQGTTPQASNLDKNTDALSNTNCSWAPQEANSCSQKLCNNKNVSLKSISRTALNRLKSEICNDQTLQAQLRRVDYKGFLKQKRKQNN